MPLRPAGRRAGVLADIMPLGCPQQVRIACVVAVSGQGSNAGAVWVAAALFAARARGEFSDKV
jgi:hypothetical protein